MMRSKSAGNINVNVSVESDKILTDKLQEILDKIEQLPDKEDMSTFSGFSRVTVQRLSEIITKLEKLIDNQDG